MARTNKTAITSKKHQGSEAAVSEDANSAPNPPNHIDSDADTDSISDVRSARSRSDSLPSLDIDTSTASESDTISFASQTTGVASARSSGDVASVTDRQLHTAARPQSDFAQQLMLHDIVSSNEEEHEPMHKWLESSTDPWSAPKAMHGETRGEHELALKSMIADFERILV